MNQEVIKLAYGNGFKAGIQFMMDKIERQYEAGKPILAMIIYIGLKEQRRI